MFCLEPVYSPWLDTHVPCRRCETCLYLKQKHWQLRTLAEYYRPENTRTWFCTFTYRKIPPNRGMITRSIQLYMKRIRKNFPGTKFRYFFVMEKGTKTGREHLHALVYCSTVIRKRDLLRYWENGFSSAKLAKQQHIPYLCKYVNKEHGRPWCSQYLGLYSPSPKTLLQQVGILPTWYIHLIHKRTHTDVKSSHGTKNN